MELTQRQKNLLEVLQSRKSEWTKSKEIKKLMALYPSDNYEGKEPEYEESVIYKLINDDMKAINRSEKASIMLISNRAKGYKLATKAEYKRYSKRRWQQIASMAKSQRSADAKARENGMMDILDDESIKERFIDSVLSEGKDSPQEVA